MITRETLTNITSESITRIQNTPPPSSGSILEATQQQLRREANRGNGHSAIYVPNEMVEFITESYSGLTIISSQPDDLYNHEIIVEWVSGSAPQVGDDR